MFSYLHRIGWNENIGAEFRKKKKRTKYLDLRSWQKEAHYECKDKPRIVNVAPCGSGKSHLAVAMEVSETIESGYTRKQLVIVPQKHLGRHFAKAHLRINGVNLTWIVETDCCNKNPSPIADLKKFLLGSPRDFEKTKIQGEVRCMSCVATHASLVILWSRLTKEEKKKALKNLTIYIDECHHITVEELIKEISESESIENKEIDSLIKNGLGTVFYDLIDSTEPTLRIRMMTGTLYRGDKLDIIPQSKMKDFFICHYPWNIHYRTLGIRRFYYKNILYKKSPIDDIMVFLKRNKDHYNLILLPSTGNKFRDEKTLSEFMTHIESIFKKSEILDLVTPNTQEINKIKLVESKKIRIVIACQLFNEGTDWPPCDRIYNTDPSCSWTREHQRLGRPLRSFKGKNSIWIINYIPEIEEGNEEEKIRHILSDRFNALLAKMQITTLHHNFMVPALPIAKIVSIGNKGTIDLSLRLGTEFEAELISRYDKLGLKEKSPQLLEALRQELLEKYYPEVDDVVSKANLSLWIKWKMVGLLGVHLSHMKHTILMKKATDITFLRENGFDKIVKETGFFGSVIMGTKEPLTPKDMDIVAEEINKKFGQGLKKDFLDFQLHNIKIDKPSTPQQSLLGRRSDLWVKYNNKIGRVLSEKENKLEVVFYKYAHVMDNRIFLKREGKNIKTWSFRPNLNKWVWTAFLSTPINPGEGDIISDGSSYAKYKTEIIDKSETSILNIL